MTNPCLTCRFANWKRTANGRLHPSGDGRCEWVMPEIVMPKSRYWIGFGRGMPWPAGGQIERNDDKDCAAFEAATPSRAATCL